MLATSSPAPVTASTICCTTSWLSIMKWVMGWRMMEYRASRMGKGSRLHRHPDMGLIPSSA